jgi:hypothetical protein
MPVNYFFNDEVTTRVDAELDLLVALRDGHIRQIAVRAAGLSTESLQAIAEMVEHVRRLEGLSDSSPSRSAAGPVGPTSHTPTLEEP